MAFVPFIKSDIGELTRVPLLNSVARLSYTLPTNANGVKAYYWGGESFRNSASIYDAYLMSLQEQPWLSYLLTDLKNTDDYITFFGIRIYNEKTPTNYFVCWRLYVPNNENNVFRGGWYLYNSDTANYTALYTDEGSNGIFAHWLRGSYSNIHLGVNRYSVDANEVICCTIELEQTVNPGTAYEYKTVYNITMVLNLTRAISNYGNLSNVITDPNEQDPDGTSGENGGGGDFDPTSDIITRPSISVINGLASMNAGFVTLYKVTMADLQLLASYLYTDDIWQIVSNYFSHPSDMIAGLLLVPVAVNTGAAYRPKVGLHTFNINLPIITEQYYDIDFGNLTISEYYGSCFDYAPYTQIEIYLPFIGTRSLDVDEIMGKTLHLSYRIDVMNGDCVATISYYDGLNRSVRYEFSGNCGQQIPVSAQNMDAVVQNAIAFATTAVTAIAGAAGAGAAAAGAAAEAGATAAEVETISTAAQASANLSAAGDIAGAGVSAVMNSKAHIERTGNIGSGLGLLSVLTPYIVKKVPRQSLPANYASFEGYPANLYGTLSEFSGYTVVDEIRLQNISATDGEIAEIYNILKGGVYV